MNLKQHYSFFLFLIAAISASISHATPTIAVGSVKRIDGATVEISGYIAPGLEKDFQASLTPATRTVILSSPGGATVTALEIAETIQARHLDIVVRKYCLSSCANYLFIAGRRKTVEPNSIVAWHGGHSHRPFPVNISSQPDVVESARLLRREQMLYLRAKSSLDLIIYSGLLTEGKPTGKFTEAIAFGQQVKIPVLDSEFTQWAPTRSELERLGIQDIQSFWHPGSAENAKRLLDRLGVENSRTFTGKAWSYVPKTLRLTSADR